MRRLKLILYYIWVAFFALSVGEIGLRLAWSDPDDRYYIFPPHLKAKFVREAPNFLYETKRTEVSFTTNSYGLRGQEPSGKHRVITFGGSSTESNSIAEEFTWSGVLQAKLRESIPDAWVASAGKAGSSTLHHTVQVERLSDELKPDAVVVLIGANDFFEATGWAFPSGDPNIKEKSLRNAFSVHPRPRLHLYENLALYRLGRSIYESKMKEKTALQQDSEGNWMLKMRALRAKGKFVDTPKDVNAFIEEEFKPNIRVMVSAAKKRGVKVILATHPVLWSEHPSPESERLIYTGGVGYWSDFYNQRTSLVYYSVSDQ